MICSLERLKIFKDLFKEVSKIPKNLKFVVVFKATPLVNHWPRNLRWKCLSQKIHQGSNTVIEESKYK